MTYEKVYVNRIWRVVFARSCIAISPNSKNYCQKLRINPTALRLSFFTYNRKSFSMSSATLVESQPPVVQEAKDTIEEMGENVGSEPAAEVATTGVEPGSSAAAGVEASEKKVMTRVKKRKMVLMMSYCGEGYLGMQKNPGTRTIEGEFFDAMLKANYIDQEAYDKPQSFKFQRAARTDKNVSAARQIVSFKGAEHLDINKLNELLPPSIRIMGMKRVTQGFDAKQNCDARTYSYMTPTFAFAPIDVSVSESYRITPEVLAHARKLFHMYLGTKNFHNFTSKKRPNDPSAMRHIISFVCGDPFIKDGLEYVVLRVRGQSFMLHQIRKMIGLCTAILRGFANESVFESAFGLQRIDIPRAPGLGLMLEEVHYYRYDNRYGSDGCHETITWEDVNHRVEKFCDEYIYPIITRTENEEKSMWNWLATLVFHTYAVRSHEDHMAGQSEIRKAFYRAALEAGKEVKEDDEEEEGEDEKKPKRQKMQS